jgi:hypothetical protein
MVMQVLVLAVQNAVDRSVMGVATSGSTMFRQIGGSIGVALFGAIFVNRLHAHVPPGLPVPKTVDPATVRHLPPPVHDVYVSAFAVSLRPVFLVGAAVGVVAFALTWLLREVPLRKTTGVGEPVGVAADKTV